VLSLRGLPLPPTHVSICNGHPGSELRCVHLCSHATQIPANKTRARINVNPPFLLLPQSSRCGFLFALEPDSNPELVGFSNPTQTRDIKPTPDSGDHSTKCPAILRNNTEHIRVSDSIRSREHRDLTAKGLMEYQTAEI
jgi:hypothetical protein